MSKFFVGQRVRIVHVERYQQLLGAECRVAALAVIGMMLDGRLVDGCVRLDIPAPGFPGLFIASPPDWLEPILPDGHRAGEDGRCELLDELLERQREAA